MDPNKFSNLNSANDGMLMFNSGGDTRGPGHENYSGQPFTTPVLIEMVSLLAAVLIEMVSVGSTFKSESEFELFFNTDSYRVDEMEQSCGQPSAPEPWTTMLKKRVARKENAPTIPLLSKDPNYTPEEYTKVAQCWIDISEDSIYSNHRTTARMWHLIEARYNTVKLKWAYKRNKEQLCKCWDLLRVHVNNFRDIYTKLRDGRGSGESMEDVIQKAMPTSQSTGSSSSTTFG